MAERTGQGSAAAAGCRVRGHVWIEGPRGALLGAGRADLLERIRDGGSISAAARSMGMSYRRAWRLVDSMNRQLQTPLVVSVAGGRRGGGTRLTAAGERAILAFRELDRAFRRFARQRSRALAAIATGPDRASAASE